MSDDLVERLRAHQRTLGPRMDLHHIAMDAKRAADRINQQAAEIERLQAVLTNIANAYKHRSVAGDMARAALKVLDNEKD